MLLHIEQLDSKYVGGAQKFLPGHAQWRRLFLLIPPFRCRGQRLERVERRYLVEHKADSGSNGPGAPRWLWLTRTNNALHVRTTRRGKLTLQKMPIT